MIGHHGKSISTKRFAMLPVQLILHISVTTLDHGSFRILVLLTAEYRGKNNGAIGLTRDQAKAAGVRGKNTLYKGLKDLIERGLIEITHPASRVPPRPAMYALNWLAIDDTEYTKKSRIATHNYRNWDPAKNNFRGSATGNKAVRHGEQGNEIQLHGLSYGEQGADFGGSTVPVTDHPLESTIGVGGRHG